MRRRQFISGIGGVMAAWPLAARGQRLTMPMVGFLSSMSPGESARFMDAFLEGLHETAYVEGRNVEIAYRWAGGVYERLQPRARELAERGAAVIVAAGDLVSAIAAKAATSSIPIVFTGVDDPVGAGLVESLQRPGGNVTGMSLFANGLGRTHLELLRVLLPMPRPIALLVNPRAPEANSYLQDVGAAASEMGQQIMSVEASTDSELEAAFASLVPHLPAALLVRAEPFFNSRREQLVAFAGRQRLPAIYGHRDFALRGGLISYGPSVAGNYREAGNYTGRILKGEKPAALPVRQTDKCELVINQATARLLGVEVPEALLARADEVLDDATRTRLSPDEAFRENKFWPP
jgi:putative ABC transport system substrate-binding protein